VTREGAVKVMDFGIARLQSDATAPQTSSVIGTPAYFSPEQAQGLPVDSRSDIYSLGCVLYELLAHRPPFTGDTPVAIAYKQVNESPVPPSQVNPDVPPALDAVVMKCMAKNPANRYQSAAELSADLDRVRKGQEVEATPLLAVGAAGAATQVIARQPTQVMPPPEPEDSSRKVWLGVLIALLVFLILAGGGYLLAKALNTPDTPTTGLMLPLKGVPFANAKAQLEGLDLNLNIVRATKESDQTPDIVLAQDPEEGATLNQGDTVTLTVAVPPKDVTVPDLTCKTLAEATNLLGSDFELGTKTPVTSDACPPDTIVSQDPAADKKAPVGTFINVDVVSGPASITLQDYTCQNFNKAKKALEKLELKVTYGGTVASLPQCPNTAFVAQQDPLPGSSVEVGSTVTLFTGSETSTSPSPSP
jgi:serine/threonine-protein kinase